MLREEVTETDIADIISKWSGIPVTKLVASERSKLLGLTDELHKRVIGQDEAVEAVADAIQRWASFCEEGQELGLVAGLLQITFKFQLTTVNLFLFSSRPS